MLAKVLDKVLYFGLMLVILSCAYGWIAKESDWLLWSLGWSIGSTIGYTVLPYVKSTMRKLWKKRNAE